MRWIAKPWAAWAMVAAAVALASTALNAGLGGDDYIVMSQARPDRTIRGLSSGLWDLHTTAPREPAASRALIEDGVFPWWADPAVRIAMFRPLTSLLFALDFTLWPDSPRTWHAHSLFWLLALLCAAVLLFRITSAGPFAAAVAILLFALDDGHAVTVGWLATRNTLISGAFAVLALWAHARWRKQQWRPGAFLGPVFFATGLLAGETALATLAYLLAYELFLDEGSVSGRAWRLSAFAVVTSVWAIAYVELRCGTFGTSHYLDPLREPGAYLQQSVFRLPILLVAQLLGPWSDLWPIYGGVHPALPYLVWVFALLALAAIALVSTPRLRRDPAARFFAAGMVLSALPLCAGLPSDRTLVMVSVGAMGLAGSVVDGILNQGDRGALGPATRWLQPLTLALIIAVQLVANLYWVPQRAKTNAFFAPPFERANATVPLTPDVREKTVVLVNPPLEPMVSYMSFMRDALGQPRPRRVRLLATGASALTVTRADERTLSVRPEKGFLSSASDNMLRSARHPLPLGRAVELTDLAIDIPSLTADGRPAEAVFHFNVPLEDPSMVWLQWKGQGYAPFMLPGVGQAVSLPAADFVKLFLPVSETGKP